MMKPLEIAFGLKKQSTARLRRELKDKRHNGRRLRCMMYSELLARRQGRKRRT
jgi:hypothetical protein